MDKQTKQKNIKDLEYNHTLSKKNLAMVLIGTALITTAFTKNLAIPLERSSVIFILSITAIASWKFFNEQLELIKQDILKL